MFSLKIVFQDREEQKILKMDCILKRSTRRLIYEKIESFLHYQNSTSCQAATQLFSTKNGSMLDKKSMNGFLQVQLATNSLAKSPNLKPKPSSTQ